MATEPCGQASRLRCRYHGWTYDLAGRLRGTPEFDGVADFRREDNGLPALAVAVWGSLVWVHAGERPPPLPDYLAPLPERLPGPTLEALRFVARRDYEVACNWKVYVDNYLDGGYHVNTVHPGLAGVLDYAHYRTEIHAWTQRADQPAQAGERPRLRRRVRGGDAAHYWWVFPNFMVNLYQGVMDTNLVLPLGPDRCRVIFDFYFAETEGAAAEAFVAREHGGGASDSAGRHRHLRRSAARPAQPVVSHRAVQRPPRDRRVSFPSAAGDGGCGRRSPS